MHLLVQKITINNENISKCMSKIELFGLTSNFKLLCPALNYDPPYSVSGKY